MRQEEKKPDNNNVFKKIHDNYISMNEKMVGEMEIASAHGGVTGNYREEMWMGFFRSIIPRKYTLAQGVLIIDSYGNVSNEVDIAVYDEQYTPYVFQYNTLKFIPIEAVVIAIECKSTSWSMKKLKDWAKSIDGLITCRSGISRIVPGYAVGVTNQTQVKTRPLKILASIKDGKEIGTLEKRIMKLGDAFDFIIQKQDGILQVHVNNGDKPLGWWGIRLNNRDQKNKLKKKTLEHKLAIHMVSKQPSAKALPDNKLPIDTKGLEDALRDCPELKFDDNLYLTNTLRELEVKGNPILSLNLQLNQLLMLVNNPMMFPHFAYAKRFQEIIEKEERMKQKSKNK